MRRQRQSAQAAQHLLRTTLAFDSLHPSLKRLNSRIAASASESRMILSRHEAACDIAVARRTAHTCRSLALGDSVGDG